MSDSHTSLTSLLLLLFFLTILFLSLPLLLAHPQLPSNFWRIHFFLFFLTASHSQLFSSLRCKNLMQDPNLNNNISKEEQPPTEMIVECQKEEHILKRMPSKVRPVLSRVRLSFIPYFASFLPSFIFNPVPILDFVGKH